MPDELHDTSPPDSSWHVYLFALTDCSAFKVGFSRNPLQRIHCFSRRYFEHFDLHQSLLLRASDAVTARSIEAALKLELAEFRADWPAWVPEIAGGHTEWFSAVHFGFAAERLRSFASTEDALFLANAAEYFGCVLKRLSPSFELWALSHVQHMPDRSASSATRLLCDWVDAYRYFDVPLFTDQPEVLRALEHAMAISRASARSFLT